MAVSCRRRGGGGASTTGGGGGAAARRRRRGGGAAAGGGGEVPLPVEVLVQVQVLVVVVQVPQLEHGPVASQQPQAAQARDRHRRGSIFGQDEGAAQTTSKVQRTLMGLMPI